MVKKLLINLCLMVLKYLNYPLPKAAVTSTPSGGGMHPDEETDASRFDGREP
jgi:hypothetical protein